MGRRSTTENEAATISMSRCKGPGNDSSLTKCRGSKEGNARVVRGT